METPLNKYDLESLEEEVKAISESVTKIRESGLSRRAIELLIQHSAPGLPYGKRVSIKMIRAVMDGMEGLHEFLFSPEYEDED